MANVQIRKYGKQLVVLFLHKLFLSKDNNTLSEVSTLTSFHLLAIDEIRRGVCIYLFVVV
jgi:hypothetical protein